jgi:hypothetical protein
MYTKITYIYADLDAYSTSMLCTCTCNIEKTFFKTTNAIASDKNAFSNKARLSLISSFKKKRIDDTHLPRIIDLP